MSPSLRARVSCGLHPVRASTPGPTGGFSRLEDLNSRCWRGRQPPPRDSPVWSCLGHGATVEKLGQSFNTCEISDKNLDFQFLFKPLQTVPHSPSHLPYRARAGHQPRHSQASSACRAGHPVGMCKPGEGNLGGTPPRGLTVTRNPSRDSYTAVPVTGGQGHEGPWGRGGGRGSWPATALSHIPCSSSCVFV